MNSFSADAAFGGTVGYPIGSNPFLVETVEPADYPGSLSALYGRLGNLREGLSVAFHRAQLLADRLSGPVPQPGANSGGVTPAPDGILPSLHLEATGLEHWLEGLRGELGRIEKALG